MSLFLGFVTTSQPHRLTSGRGDAADDDIEEEEADSVLGF